MFLRNLIKKDHNTESHLIVLGSSSSEVFDYIFGDNALYHPYWASGWSARGLRKHAAREYIAKILQPIPRESNVILNFGNTDITFNARYMAVSRGFYDFRTLLNEAALGLSSCVDFLAKLGFKRTLCCFASPPVSLPQKYWNRFGAGRQLPDKALGLMYKEFAEFIGRQHETINLITELSNGEKGGYLLKDEYKRSIPNHHPDYIKTQANVWKSIKSIPNIIPARQEPLTDLYKHHDYNIAYLMKQAKPRPRTCV